MDDVNNYLNSLDDKQKKGIEIATRELKSSFDIRKSIGYLKWKKLKESK